MRIEDSTGDGFLLCFFIEITKKGMNKLWVL